MEDWNQYDLGETSPKEEQREEYQWSLSSIQPPQRVQSSPEIRPQQGTGQKGSGKLIYVVGIMAAALLFLGIFSASNYSALQRLEEYMEEYGLDLEDDWLDDDDEVGETTIPLAESGIKLQLPLVSRGANESAMSLTDIYKKCADSVVYIYTTDPESYGSEGSGVIFSEDGYLITNAHVIEGGSRAKVTLHDGQSYEAKLVGMDTTSDIAVLKIDADNLKPAVFANSDELEVGETVVAIGNPLGYELRGSMTQGIVSAVNRTVWSDGQSYIQTSAPISSGNSGGALIDENGRVIGITTLKYVTDLDYESYVENLGFAVPTTTVKRIVDSLLLHGYVKQPPQLGMTVLSLSEDMAQEAGVESGLRVEQVLPGSAAEEAGLVAGDILVEAEGQTLRTSQDLLTLRDGLQGGDSLHVKIYRDGKYMEITILLRD